MAGGGGLPACPDSPSRGWILWWFLTLCFLCKEMRGLEGLLRFFSHQRSVATSYGGVCFHFKVELLEFFHSFWVDLKDFDLLQERQGKTWNLSPLRSSHNFKLFQFSCKSPGNVISSLWRWWWPWAEIFFGVLGLGDHQVVMHFKTLLSGWGWFLQNSSNNKSCKILEELDLRLTDPSFSRLYISLQAAPFVY